MTGGRKGFVLIQVGRRTDLKRLCHFDRSFELGISSFPQGVSRKLDRELRDDTVVLQHPSLPGQVGGDREAKNVSVANLVCAAAQETAGRLRSHDGRQIIFLRKC